MEIARGKAISTTKVLALSGDGFARGAPLRSVQLGGVTANVGDKTAQRKKRCVCGPEQFRSEEDACYGGMGGTAENGDESECRK